MDEMLDQKTLIPEMMPLSFPSNSAMVTWAWPLTRMKAIYVCALPRPALKHYKIIHTHVYENKTNIPAKIVECPWRSAQSISL